MLNPKKIKILKLTVGKNGIYIAKVKFSYGNINYLVTSCELSYASECDSYIRGVKLLNLENRSWSKEVEYNIGLFYPDKRGLTYRDWDINNFIVSLNKTGFYKILEENEEKRKKQ